MGAMGKYYWSIKASSATTTRLASVLSSPAFSNRFPMVPVDSSEARMPFPFSARRSAVSFSDSLMVAINTADNEIAGSEDYAANDMLQTTLNQPC